MMKLNKRWVTGVSGGVLLLIVIVLVIVDGGKKRAVRKAGQAKVDAQCAPRHIEIERIQAHPVESNRAYPGVVQASKTSELSFRVGGPLVTVHVTQGAPVKKGDLLMQIDPRDFEDAVASGEALLAGAHASQRKAQLDYQRITRLFETKVVSPSEFDAASSARDAADAAVKNAQAQLRMARHALADTAICAPYDGTVTAQFVENYEMVKVGQVVMNYHNIETLEVVVAVPENEIIRRSIGPDSLARISFPAASGRSVEARLTEWSSLANALTRTYAVTFEFNAPANLKILPGMTSNIFWHSPCSENRLTVPVSALLSQADGSTSLWVCRDSGSSAERRTVVVGDLVGTSRVILESGVSEGEIVVVKGGRLLHENSAVKVAQK